MSFYADDEREDKKIVTLSDEFAEFLVKEADSKGIEQRRCSTI